VVASYGHYQVGSLPEPGGWLDQPAAWLTAVSLVDSLVRHHEHVEVERARSRGR
jgi:hypothetical protein